MFASLTNTDLPVQKLKLFNVSVLFLLAVVTQLLELRDLAISRATDFSRPSSLNIALSHDRT
jgi:hypothetical protein